MSDAKKPLGLVMPAAAAKAGAGAKQPGWAAQVPTGTKLLSVTGLVLGVAFLGSFGAWGALAPISGAAVAPGVVAAAGQNLSIQHLEGGIVRKIDVLEGAHVKAGQPLIDLDPTVASAQRDRLNNQIIGLEARAARLSSERDGNGTIAFEPELVEKARAAEPVRVASAASVAPRAVQPKIPSKSSVSKAATVSNAINLRKVNLIGVYGKPSNRRALVRLSNGRYQKVEVGDRIDGGRVSAIGDSELRYVRRGRNVVLKMPN